MAIRSRAPIRVELAGESTELPEYYEQHGGFVVNMAINKYSYISLNPIKEGIKINLQNKGTIEFPNLKSIKYEGDIDLIKAIVKNKNLANQEIFLRNDMPPNTGLGTNASITTALLGAINKLKGESQDKAHISEEAYKIGYAELGIKIGRQNHYASAFGGVNGIEFKKDGSVFINQIKLSKYTLRELEKHLVLVYIGKRINSDSLLNAPKKENFLELDALESLKKIAYDMKHSLEKENTISFGKLLDQTWLIKKDIYPGMSNHYIDHLYKIAKNNGAIGGRVIGAGKGGHMLFYAEDNKEPQLVKKLQENGARVIDFGIDTDGLEVWEAEK